MDNYKIKGNKLLQDLKRYTRTPVFRIFIILFAVIIIVTVTTSTTMIKNHVPLSNGEADPQTAAVKCLKRFSLPDTIPQDTFQHVKDTNIYIYSAYLDRRIEEDHRIRVIGLSKRNPKAVFCEIHYEDDYSISVPAQPSLALPVDDDGVVKDPGSFEYKPYLFSCNETAGMPIKVRVVSL